MTFAREAWPFVVPPFLAAAALLAIGWRRSAVTALLLAVAILLFFRIPRRVPIADPTALLAPASGRVMSVELVRDEALGAGDLKRVATFLSVFDVHVQRAPANAKVLASERTPGRKVAAFRRDAAAVNESRLTVLQLESGDVIGVRQIAGLVARRIVGYGWPGDELERGELLGLIKFGSRVDLLVPATYEILVEPGDRVRDGLTPMARAVPEQ